MTKIAGSTSGSGSISRRHGSADPDPNPHQNVMDPEHRLWVWICWIRNQLTSWIRIRNSELRTRLLTIYERLKEIKEKEFNNLSFLMIYYLSQHFFTMATKMST